MHVGAIAEVAQSPSLRHLAPNERFTCAAPAYVERHGAPMRPSDLQRHTCLVLRENDADVTFWRFRDRANAKERVKAEQRLASNDGEVVKSWALAGLGVLIRSEWDVADELRAGKRVRVLVP